jgi:hypothetical protein
VGRLLDLLNILGEFKEGKIPYKHVQQLSYKNKYYDPQVDLEIHGVLINQAVIDFRSQVNVLPQDMWIRLGRPSLAPTLNYLKLTYQILIEHIGILINVETHIMGILTLIDFKVIDLVEGMPTYVALVNQPWGQQMKANIFLEKEKIKLKGNGRKTIIPLDPNEGKPWSESLDEDHEVRCLYQIINEQIDYVKPNTQGEILAESPLSVRHNSDSVLYNWQIKNYEVHSKYCWTIEAIPIKCSRTCYSIQAVPIVYENRLRQTLTLIPIDNTMKNLLRYNERNALSMHVEEVSKSVREQGRIQILVEKFTYQATRWWETHSPRLQTWTNVSTYFVERFGEKKLSKSTDIPIFKVGYDLVEHINCCENEW